MLTKPFSIHSHNSHYVGNYLEREMEWRRICAIEKINNLQRMLGSRDIDSVLEVGCGTGAVLAEAARRRIGRVHAGVDIADPSAHAEPAAAGLNLSTYDGRRLPFPDSSFDLVYASHVVEHVLDPRGFILELSRVAKSLIYLEVPCELHARTNHAALQRTLNIGHINSYTPDSFMILLQTVGLRILDLDIFDHTREVHSFHTTRAKGVLKMALRRAIAAVSRPMAARVFTFHCGALAQPEKDRAALS